MVAEPARAGAVRWDVRSPLLPAALLALTPDARIPASELAVVEVAMPVRALPGAPEPRLLALSIDASGRLRAGEKPGFPLADGLPPHLVSVRFDEVWLAPDPDVPLQDVIDALDLVRPLAPIQRFGRPRPFDGYVCGGADLR